MTSAAERPGRAVLRARRVAACVALVVWSALSQSLAYNTCKAYVGHATGVRASREWKDSVRGTIPWGVGALALLLAGSQLRGRQSWRSRALGLAGYAIALNGIGLSRGTGAWASANLSFAYFVAGVLVARCAGRPWRRLRARAGAWSERARGSRSRQAGVLLLLVGIALLLAFLSQLYLLQRANTLHENGRWHSEKLVLAKGVNGAVSYVTTRTALYRSRLNLGKWHGYQQVFHPSPLDFRELRFSFWLEPESYLSLLLRPTGNAAGISGADGATGSSAQPPAAHGLRLSAHPVLGNLAFVVAEDGEFQEAAALELPALSSGWHSLRLDRREEGDPLRIDGEPVALPLAIPEDALQLAFRGCHRDSAVDDVVVRLQDGGTLSESFRNRNDAATRFLQGLAGVLLFETLLGGLFWFLRARLRAAPSYQLLAVNLLALIWLSLWIAADFWYLAKRHPDEVDFQGYASRAESTEQVLERVRTSHGSKDADVDRVLFVGTSQTWGAGARREEDAVPERIGALLDGASGPRKRVECINAGVRGSRSGELLQFFRDEWRWLEPDLVVINLGNNDPDAEALAENLRSFIALGREVGAETLLIHEPISIERVQPAHGANRLAMRAVAQAESVRLVEMHERMKAHANAGFLWWDHVHLTSFGMRLFANELLPEIRACLAE